MPVYVYAVRGADGALRDHFEVRQRMSDARLTQHPATGEPVERVPQMPNIVTRSAGSSNAAQDLVDRGGFTRYERAGDGTYVKTGGSTAAPDTLKR